MPIDRPTSVGVRPAATPAGEGLLGWLRVNYPQTYAAIVTAPRDSKRNYEPKGSHQRKKRRVISPTTATQDAAQRPISSRTRS